MIKEYQRKMFGGMANLMFKHAYLYAQMREGKIPDVYLQDEKYFKKYEDEIREMFGEGIGYLPYVSIHVRRGDYITSHKGFYVDLCSTDYYEKAVEMFPMNKFLVFCKDGQGAEQDELDKKWCMDYFEKLIPGRFQFMSSDDEVEDFNMMASCQSNILANSSFSWWAGYMNKNPVKQVVCPKEWFTDGIKRISLPEKWIKI